MGVAVRATKATPEQCFIFGGKCHCSFLLATHCPCWRKASASQSAYTAASPLSKPISHAAAALHASAGGVSVGCSWNMPATFTAICPSWNILRASGDAHCSCSNAATSVPSQMLSMVTPPDQQGARGTSPGFRHRTAFQGPDPCFNGGGTREAATADNK